MWCVYSKHRVYPVNIFINMPANTYINIYVNTYIKMLVQSPACFSHWGPVPTFLYRWRPLAQSQRWVCSTCSTSHQCYLASLQFWFSQPGKQSCAWGKCYNELGAFRAWMFLRSHWKVPLETLSVPLASLQAQLMGYGTNINNSWSQSTFKVMIW